MPPRRRNTALTHSTTRTTRKLQLPDTTARARRRLTVPPPLAHMTAVAAAAMPASRNARAAAPSRRTQNRRRRASRRRQPRRRDKTLLQFGFAWSQSRGSLFRFWVRLLVWRCVDSAIGWSRVWMWCTGFYMRIASMWLNDLLVLHSRGASASTRGPRRFAPAVPGWT